MLSTAAIFSCSLQLSTEFIIAVVWRFGVLLRAYLEGDGSSVDVVQCDWYSCVGQFGGEAHLVSG